MFGTSEAFAESIGSTLKRFAKSLSTARCVESTTLRSAGLIGHGRCGEDGLLELFWAKFFFTVQKKVFSLPQFEGATEVCCHGARFCDTEPCAYGR